MTQSRSSSATAHQVTALRRAAVRATRAPSIHNTQPWCFLLDGRTLEVRSDPARRLAVLDQRGRQLLISCGCALFNARVSLAASGYGVHVERFPAPGDPQLLARLTPEPNAELDGHDRGLAELDAAIDQRQTNRGPFAAEPILPGVVEAVLAAAVAEGARTRLLASPEELSALAQLTREAARIEADDPAYQLELRAWTTSDPTRLDGVPAAAVGGPAGDLPLRNFPVPDGHPLPPDSTPARDQVLFVLGSDDDTPPAWLRTGEALERALLEASRQGLSTRIDTQAVETVQTNLLLRQQLNLRMHPHVLVRLGHAPAAPASRRRRLVDMLTDVSDQREGV